MFSPFSMYTRKKIRLNWTAVSRRTLIHTHTHTNCVCYIRWAYSDMLSPTYSLWLFSLISLTKGKLTHIFTHFFHILCTVGGRVHNNPSKMAYTMAFAVVVVCLFHLIDFDEYFCIENPSQIWHLLVKYEHLAILVLVKAYFSDGNLFMHLDWLTRIVATKNLISSKLFWAWWPFFVRISMIWGVNKKVFREWCLLLFTFFVTSGQFFQNVHKCSSTSFSHISKKN